MKSICLLIVASLCAFKAGAQEAPKTEKECRAKGGEWGTFRMPGYPGAEAYCVLPAKDAGKECRSSSDCSVGVCVAKEGIMSVEGKKAKGVCPRSATGAGCVARVEGGKAQPMICTE